VAVDSKAFPLRFRDDRLRERLRTRAQAEHRSMNDLANDAIERLLDAGTTRPAGTVDKATLRKLMLEIAQEDREIFEALKNA
jgi:plasmid stability protein